MKAIKILCLVVVLLFITACGPKEVPEPEPIVVPEPEPVVVEPEPEPVVELEPEEPKPQYDEAVKKLLAKKKDIRSYSYGFDSKKKALGGKFEDLAGYSVFIKGNKVKKVYGNLINVRAEVQYNIVYLDLDKETAVGVCDDIDAVCRGLLQKAIRLDYEEQKLPITPLEILDNLGYDAHKVGQERIDNRNTMIVEYTNADGDTEKVSIDDYYIMPLKRDVYKNGEVVESNYFNDMALNSVKDEDVTMLSHFEIID